MKKLILGVCLFALVLTGCTAKKQESLTIFHAGSLSIPLKKMTAQFNKKFPNVKVFLEGAGSRTCARKITDLKKKADVMFSADSSVIQTLLIPEYADWNINFATNEMAIMFTPKSKYANEINSKNWPDILLRPDVNYGHSDPNADPCGYRSQLVWQLAEKYYKIGSLYQKLKNKKHFIRPKETDLLALLESHTMDYLFIYRSVAEQHHSKYILLPDQINLKTKRYAKFYKGAKLKITGKKPGAWVTKIGKPMVYGLTIPKNAPNRKMAVEYVNFVLSKQGQDVLRGNGQPPIIPPTSQEKLKIPSEINNTVKQI
ncbi:tungstate ABC transporter substrate-binding protein WtpA [Candidatus Margulisiibacteriota bacterium]